MKKCNKILVGLLSLTLVFAVGCGEDSSSSKKETKATTTTEATSLETTDISGQEVVLGGTDASTMESTEASLDELLTGLHHVEITVKDYGTIAVELDADNAPISTTNFINLANSGFYNGLTFHRIIYGFMMQGGDPTGTGRGGSDETIKGEFASNGIHNPLSHTRGAISMARSQMPDSASSQFFIVQEDSFYLDGDYAVFGYVTEGMDIVDKICTDAIVEDGNGTVAPANQPVIESVVVLD